MTRTDAVRVPLAAVGILVVATGCILWATRGWYDDPGLPSTRQAGVVASSASAAPEGRTVVRVRVLPHGDLLVRHHIHTGTPVMSLAVTTPVDPNLSAVVVSARGLRLRAGGVAVEGATTLRNETAVFTFAASRSLRLRYVLSGALELADPGGARALARLTSLDLSYDADPGESTYVFEGAHILSLACTRRGEAEPVPCGTRQGGDWVVEVPYQADDYRVMAQLDLLR